MSIRYTIENHVAEVVMHHPPVNSITVADTWKIRDTFRELEENKDVRVIILTAEGKGFNAGIDIKEMQSVEGFEHLLSSGEACYETFNQIYHTSVPVIAAVNDFCMGLGIGLVASCDMILASSKARFGLPEVDNGALGEVVGDADVGRVGLGRAARGEPSEVELLEVAGAGLALALVGGVRDRLAQQALPLERHPLL